MARAPGMPLAQISTANPLGSFSLVIGISEAGVSVMRPASGASFESAMLAGWPCFQAGCWANAAAQAPARTAATAVRIMTGFSSVGWRILIRRRDF
jgi:hypothetical protein